MPRPDETAPDAAQGAAVGGPVAADGGDVSSPLGLRGLLAVVAIVVLCDVTMFRGYGFAGYAALFLAAPPLLAFGALRPSPRRDVWIIVAMLVLLAVRLVWCGFALQVAVGFALLATFAMALAGQRPYVPEALSFASQILHAGFRALIESLAPARLAITRQAESRHGSWLNFAMPLVALVAFGMIFVLANPDLLAIVSQRAADVFRAIREFLLRFSTKEALFWIVVAVVTAGLLRPARPRRLLPLAETAVGPAEQGTKSFLYPAFRNTLVAVCLLFAIYLVFEFQTLWFRVFPEGFYYAGYAHEGAAWLTCALALSTVTLSFIFRGAILSDPRLPRLRRLGWLWSILNFALALAVYNRLLIYINFNGMTRMRTVALFGITAVVIGFVLVLWKIAHNRNFLWLLRGELWTLALIIYLYALTPVDTLVHGYNVRRVLAGDLAPSVQISVHPNSAEGMLPLLPLTGSDNEIIRDGVRALLATEQERLTSRQHDARYTDWTAYQIADELLLRELNDHRLEWDQFANRRQRDEALQRFHDYAYQWY